jgi:hypothetical protein
MLDWDDEQPAEETQFPVSEPIVTGQKVIVDYCIFLTHYLLVLILSFSGLDCYADDRDTFNDFAKYFNNQHLSDVCIIIEEER